jgi:hypothetical protein
MGVGFACYKEGIVMLRVVHRELQLQYLHRIRRIRNPVQGLRPVARLSQNSNALKALLSFLSRYQFGHPHISVVSTSTVRKGESTLEVAVTGPLIARHTAKKGFCLIADDWMDAW